MRRSRDEIGLARVLLLLRQRVLGRFRALRALRRRPLPRLGDVEGVCDNCCSPASLRPRVCQQCIPGNAALRALANRSVW